MHPECGTLVAFQSGEFHGVRPVLFVRLSYILHSHGISLCSFLFLVLQGQRVALAQWFTLNPATSNSIDEILVALGLDPETFYLS